VSSLIFSAITLMWHDWHRGLSEIYWWNFPHWRPIFYRFLICKVLVCWSSLNSERVLVFVFVGNVLVLGTSVLETFLLMIKDFSRKPVEYFQQFMRIAARDLLDYYAFSLYRCQQMAHVEFSDKPCVQKRSRSCPCVVTLQNQRLKPLRNSVQTEVT